MAIHSTSRLLLAALLLPASACIAQAALAQNPPAAPCSASSKQDSQSAGQATKPCPPPASDNKKPSASEQFPFPGEPAKPSAETNAPNPSSSPAAKPSTAAGEHPFPTQTPPKLPGDDSSSSSSSSSADDPNAVPDTVTPPPGAEGSSTRRKLPKVQHVQSDDERVDEDLKVAKFYMRDENLPGAYLRAKDAVKVQPDYSDTHFALAEIAQKMNKKDEAVAEYQTYLKLDPGGEKAKAAQRALQDLR